MIKICVGDRIKQRCGEFAELVMLLPDYKCKVRFDNGVEKICSKQMFKEGVVSNIIINSRYVGERVLQKCGEYAELVELLDNDRCKVRFDSGVEKNCTRNTFRNGRVSTGGVRTKWGNLIYIGSRVFQNCGEYAEIIELLPNYRCIVRFDNGIEKECSIRLFALGEVANKNRTTLSIGDRVLQSCGEEAEIVDLLHHNKCVVRFDNGVTKTVQRSYFVNGTVPCISRTKRYVGERVLQKCGWYAEIIELLPESTCRVRFDNGVERVCERRLFAQGELSENNKRYVGERILQACGAVAEIVELSDNCTCKVRFSDGSTQVCSRNGLKRGIIIPPVLKGRKGNYRYCKTNELMLSMYFDEVKGHYIGLLKREDRTRYMRVLD